LLLQKAEDERLGQAPVGLAEERGVDPHHESRPLLERGAEEFSCPGGFVTVSIAAAAHAAAISIRDTGPGIPPRRFLPCSSGSTVAARRAGRGRPGVGLGLAISRAIVEGHGGTIDVASVVGAGTCFVVRLPLAPTTGDRLDSSSADTSTRGRESG